MASMTKYNRVMTNYAKATNQSTVRNANGAIAVAGSNRDAGTPANGGSSTPVSSATNTGGTSFKGSFESTLSEMNATNARAGINDKVNPEYAKWAVNGYSGSAPTYYAKDAPSAAPAPATPAPAAAVQVKPQAAPAKTPNTPVKTPNVVKPTNGSGTLKIIPAKTTTPSSTKTTTVPKTPTTTKTTTPVKTPITTKTTTPTNNKGTLKIIPAKTTTPTSTTTKTTTAPKAPTTTKTNAPINSSGKLTIIPAKTTTPANTSTNKVAVMNTTPTTKQTTSTGLVKTQTSANTKPADNAAYQAKLASSSSSGSSSTASSSSANVVKNAVSNSLNGSGSLASGSINYNQVRSNIMSGIVAGGSSAASTAYLTKANEYLTAAQNDKNPISRGIALSNAKTQMQAANTAASSKPSNVIPVVNNAVQSVTSMITSSATTKNALSTEKQPQYTINKTINPTNSISSLIVPASNVGVGSKSTGDVTKSVTGTNTIVKDVVNGLVSGKSIVQTTTPAQSATYIANRDSAINKQTTNNTNLFTNAISSVNKVVNSNSHNAPTTEIAPQNTINKTLTPTHTVGSLIGSSSTAGIGTKSTGDVTKSVTGTNPFVRNAISSIASGSSIVQTTTPAQSTKNIENRDSAINRPNNVVPMVSSAVKSVNRMMSSSSSQKQVYTPKTPTYSLTDLVPAPKSNGLTTTKNNIVL